MKIGPDLEIGSNVSKEEIEAAFDTKFGYHIAGINPRRDENNRRYILLFAREDGPYADSVTHGRFEYIGEGREGDQDEASSGNATLIDAVSANTPVFFFFQDSDSTSWEYRGPVDVRDYEVQHRDGRDVLVFQIEHQSS